jgi:hypothetical protein
MSGFEPVVAEAAAAELGSTALAAEVMAPEVLAATVGAEGVAGGAAGLSGISGLFGTGLEGLAANGGLGTLAQSAVPTMAEQLVTANPEALAQLQSAVMPSMSPDQIAQLYTNGIPTAGPGIQVAELSSNMGSVTPEMLNPNLMQPAVPELTPEQLQQLTNQNEALARVAGQYPQTDPQALGNPFGGAGDFFKELYKDFKEAKPKEKLLYGGVAALGAPIITNMFKGKKEPAGATPYDGPLSKFRYDPAQYTPLEVTPPTPYKPRYAQGGIADLGGYSDYARGGRMLKGPGDGMSDNIPATIAGKQPARLANEEFVIPADVVSHLGNGSSEAGAKQLYKMMDRVRQARTGKKTQGKQIKADKYLA